MAHGWLSFFLLGIIMCTTPGGLQGLSLKGGAVPPGVYPTYHPLHQCSHPPSWGHIPQQLPCMCNQGLVPTCQSMCNGTDGVSKPGDQGLSLGFCEPLP